MNTSIASQVRYLQRPDWPFGGAPWPRARLPLIRDWLAVAVDTVRARPELREARIALLAEQLRALDFEHALLEGRHLLADDVTAAMGAATVHARNGLLHLMDQTAPLIEGQAEDVVRDAVARAVNRITNDYEEALKSIGDAEARYVETVDPDRPAAGGARRPGRRGVRRPRAGVRPARGRAGGPGAEDPDAAGPGPGAVPPAR